MLELIPIIDVGGGRPAPAWAPGFNAGRRVALSAETPLDEVACVVANLAGLGGMAVPGTGAEAAKRVVMRDMLIAIGGLLVRDGLFEIEPSCCCGLESWRGWEKVKPGGQSPWMGHDPTPQVECRPDAAVFWSDTSGRDKKFEVESLIVSYADVHAALARADRDMSAFLGRLTEWCARESIPKEIDLVGRFAEAFRITRA